MGSDISTQLFPLDMLDCKTASDSDPRKDFFCASQSAGTVRFAMTVMHLIIIGGLFMLTVGVIALPLLLPVGALKQLGVCALLDLQFIIYSVYLRLCDRRLANQLKNMPGRLLPVGRDELSRRIQTQVFEGFAAAGQDYSPATMLNLGQQERQGTELDSVLGALLADIKAA